MRFTDFYQRCRIVVIAICAVTFWVAVVDGDELEQLTSNVLIELQCVGPAPASGEKRTESRRRKPEGSLPALARRFGPR